MMIKNNHSLRIIVIFLVFGGVYFALTNNQNEQKAIHKIYASTLNQDSTEQLQADDVQLVEAYKKIRKNVLDNSNDLAHLNASVLWMKSFFEISQTAEPHSVASAYALYEILEHQPSVLTLGDGKDGSVAELVWKIIVNLRFEDMQFANDNDRAIPLLLSTHYEILTTSVMLKTGTDSTVLCSEETQKFFSDLNAEVIQNARLLDGYTPTQVVQDKLYEYKQLRQKNNKQVTSKCKG